MAAEGGNSACFKSDPQDYRPSFSGEPTEERTWTIAIAELLIGPRRGPPKRRSGSRTPPSSGRRSRQSGRRSMSGRSGCERRDWRRRLSRRLGSVRADRAGNRELRSRTPHNHDEVVVRDTVGSASGRVLTLGACSRLHMQTSTSARSLMSKNGEGAIDPSP